jgi:arylsulfatase A-like enzyme
MNDIVLITADSVRYDYIEEMEFLSGYQTQSGTTVGHYTRPSLAGLLSSQYQATMKSAVTGPTIPEVMSNAGYTTIGLAPSPQLDEVFNFNRGFDKYENFVDAGNRGSNRREILGQFDILRKVYHRFFPPHAKMSDLPSDKTVVEQAVEQFNEASGPRFMWVHLMGSHRPYGRGENAISRSLDRKALFSPSSLKDSEHQEITSAYEDALSRVDTVVEDLLMGLDGDPTFIFTSDHGDEFGEEGYYYHQPQRRRTADKLVTVPIVSNDVSLTGDRCSLLDIGPMLANQAGTDPPEEWNGIDIRSESRSYTLTIAPWHNTASLRLATDDYTVTSTDGRVAMTESGTDIHVERNEQAEEVQERLQDLGYVE